MPTRQNWFEGWRLFAVLALTLVALSVWIAGMRGFEVDGVRMVIRFTARTSLLFFCLAFSAAALARLWPNAWTRWQRRNRRYLGVTFAASHGIHAIAIAAFAVTTPGGEGTPQVLVQCRTSDTEARGRLRDMIRERVRAITGINCVIELVPPRSLPRTSSGKLSRAKARNLYLSGEIQAYDIAA